MFRTSIWTVFLINILPCHWCNYCMFRSQTFIHQCLFGRHTVHHTVLRTPHSFTYTTQFYVHHTVLLTPHSSTNTTVLLTPHSSTYTTQFYVHHTVLPLSWRKNSTLFFGHMILYWLNDNYTKMEMLKKEQITMIKPHVYVQNS